MAIYRAIQTSFWTDAKIADTFSPDEKLIYLYLLTNPRTNLCGCYELSTRRAAFEIGLKKDQVEKLLASLQEKRVIVFEVETSEVLIVNWHRYNWTLSPKLKKPLSAEINRIKHRPFREYLEKALDGYSNDTVSDDEGYRIDTTVLFCSDTVPVTVPVTVPEKSSKRASDEDDFEDLWKLYPRKQGKKEAFTAYKRALKEGTSKEEIRAGIEAYREYIAACDIESQYVKQGGTFFSQRAWTDDWTPTRKRDKFTQQIDAIDQWGKRYEYQNDS